MKKYISRGIIAVAVVLFILPSTTHAASIINKTNTDGKLNLYVRSDNHLLHITREDGVVKGQFWDEGRYTHNKKKRNQWSKKQDLLVDTDEEFTTRLIVGEFGGGALALFGIYPNYDEFNAHFITFRKGKFAVHEQADVFVHDLVMRKKGMTLIQCKNGDVGYATEWSFKNGLSAQTELEGSQCNFELQYISGKKAQIIDYHSGNVYNRKKGYSLITSKDFSELGYTDADDDWDAQGNHPRVYKTRKGDLAMAYEDKLYGYSFVNGWQPIIDGVDFSDNISWEYDKPLLITGDSKQVFAFTATEDKKTYGVYRWKSQGGWEQEKTYNFDVATDVIFPDTVKKEKSAYWGFYQKSTEKFLVHRWSKKHGYKKIATKNLGCVDLCKTVPNSSQAVEFDVSKKNKVFITWNANPAIYLSAWDPKTDTWDDKRVVEEKSAGKRWKTYVTTGGEWIVVFYENDTRKAIRWTPDGSWGSKKTINEDQFYFYDDSIYLADLGPNNTALVTRLRWKKEKKEVATVSNVSSLGDYYTAFFKEYMLLYYTNTSKKKDVEMIELQ